MDNSQRYAELLTQALRRVVRDRANVGRLKVRSVCDVEAGQFLIIATGWEMDSWRDVILFHAWLKDGKVVVEENNFEKMLEELLEVGIAESDIVDAEELEEMERSLV
ncbi:MAG: XisI protein [Cyanobacteria bacterium CAN_BIN43]|nr:XisI protein [Cyanobacteria bacterium CAN_BIN43]